MNKKRRLSIRRTEELQGFVFVSPWIIGFLCFALGPMLFSLYSSFTNYNITSRMDFIGLDNVDRKVLKAMLDYYNGGPVGIESLAATLNEESDTIVDVVEPYLLKIGYIKRTPRGRQLTPVGRKHIQGTNKQELF